ncbi:MAG: hypothetical protein QXU92_00200 [Candidatus Diapherotrites archaeon]
MDRDKLVLIGLTLLLVLLVFAFLGVLAITGFLIFFTNDKVVENKQVVPIYEAQVVNNNSETSNNETSSEEITENTEEKVQVELAPVCGNKVKEANEECEVDADCGNDKVCKSCKCEQKPIEEPKIPKLDNIKVEEVVFFCPPEFEGKRGLGIKIIHFKNTGQTDFSYLKPVTIKAQILDTTDTLSTNNAYKFSAKAGKTASIYQKDLARTSAPFIFLGDRPGELKLTITFGNTGYIEYNYNVLARDFAAAGCL